MNEPRPADSRIGVVVVNFGSHKLLDANIPYHPDAQIFVVDNWHSDAERSAVALLAHERGWSLVHMPTNRGFGAAANAGMQAAAKSGCESFLLLNPDAVAPPALVSELRRHVQANRLELVAPRITDATGRTVFRGVELLLNRGRMRRARSDAAHSREPVAFWLTGACLALHRDALARVAGFAEDYFLYWEDVDLCIRAQRAGCTLVVRDDLVAQHDEGGTQGRTVDDRAKSNYYYYYNCRNRLLLAARLLPRRTILRWLIATPAASWEILMRGGKRQLLRSRAPLWAALRGTRDGVRAALSALRHRSTLIAP